MGCRNPRSWFPALSQSPRDEEQQEKGLRLPSGSGRVLAAHGAAVGEAGGGTDTALSHFPPPAEEFSQRLGRP